MFITNKGDQNTLKNSKILNIKIYLIPVFLLYIVAGEILEGNKHEAHVI